MRHDNRLLNVMGKNVGSRYLPSIGRGESEQGQWWRMQVLANISLVSHEPQSGCKLLMVVNLTLYISRRIGLDRR